MANLASTLKAEISRLVRKELKGESESLKKASATYRTEIAALKRRVSELERTLKATTRELERVRPKAGPVEADEAAGGFRFRAVGMANNRKRLGLSAEDFGLLIGTSGQSIYLWEQGKAKPRAKNLPAIAALRGVGKREVAARLEALRQAA